MKKIMSTLTVIAVILSLTACGKETSSANAGGTAEESTAQEQTSVADTSTAISGISEAEQFSTDVVTTESTEQEQTPVITDASYSFGSIYIKTDTENFIYKIADNKMMSIGQNIADEFAGVIYKNGNEIINAETGEVIYDGSIMLFENGCAVILEAEESFSGNTYRLGIIDKNGEWSFPLTDITEAAKNVGMDMDLTTGYNLSMFGSDGIEFYKADGWYFYSYTAKRFIEKDDDEIETALGRKYNEAFLNNGKLFCFTEESLPHNVTETTFYSYNLASKEVKELGKGDYYFYEYDYKESILRRAAIFDEYIITWINDLVTVRNSEFEPLSTFDVSQYKKVKILDCDAERICFVCENDNNTEYFCLINSDGKLMFEPQKNDHYETSMQLTPNYIIANPNSNEMYFISIETGEKILISETYNYAISAYDFAANMAMVRKDDIYYLVDMNDPATLINPFEG